MLSFLLVQKKRLSTLGGMLFGLFFGVMITVALSGGAQAPKLPFAEIQRLNAVFERIKAAYVDEKADRELLNDAIRGMIHSLDPHSSYLEPKAFTDLKTSTQGKFGGLGIEVTMEGGFVKIITPIDDTPAARAGVQAGDVIIRLDDKPVKGLTLRDAVNLMRGEVGTDIVLTIVREGLDAPLKVKITRDIIQITSVRSERLDSDIGYLRISHFQDPTYSQMKKKLITMNEAAPLKGLVLDLRNNPGGLLSSAVAVADAFIDTAGEKKVVVSTKGRIRNSNEIFYAKKGELIPGVPIIVLINEGSASASEIVAGALQDHGRAIIAGRKSFGKGSVQTVLELSDDYAMKLTTARYYTPSDRSIQAKGIQPDVYIPQVKVQMISPTVQRTKEEDLTGHLENTENKADNPKKTTSSSTVSLKSAESLLESDFELSQAITLLKTQSIK